MKTKAIRSWTLRLASSVLLFISSTHINAQNAQNIDHAILPNGTVHRGISYGLQGETVSGAWMIVNVDAVDVPVAKRQQLQELPTNHRYWSADVVVVNGSSSNILWVRPVMFSVVDQNNAVHFAQAVYFANLQEYRRFHLLNVAGQPGIEDWVQPVFVLPKSVVPQRLQILRLTPGSNGSDILSAGGIVVELAHPQTVSNAREIRKREEEAALHVYRERIAEMLQSTKHNKLTPMFTDSLVFGSLNNRRGGPYESVYESNRIAGTEIGHAAEINDLEGGAVLIAVLVNDKGETKDFRILKSGGEARDAVVRRFAKYFIFETPKSERGKPRAAVLLYWVGF